MIYGEIVPMECRWGEYRVTDDRSCIDVHRMCTLLHTTYRACSRDPAIIEKSMNNSLCFGLFHNTLLIGFGRVITDAGVFAVLLDVVIDERYRGKGWGKKLVAFMMEHPTLTGLSCALWTKDAQSFYTALGFRKPPEIAFMIRRPDAGAQTFHAPS